MEFQKLSDIVFSAIIFCSMFVRKSISVWSLFRLETNLNNLLFNHGLLVQLNGSSVSECSLKCLMMDNCVSFQIQDDLELCRLYWTHFLLSSTGTPSNGWKTYSSTGQLQTICDISVCLKLLELLKDILQKRHLKKYLNYKLILKLS